MDRKKLAVLLQLISDDEVNNTIFQPALDLVLLPKIEFDGAKSKKEQKRNTFELRISRFQDDQFYEHFQMSKTTFQKLLYALHAQRCESEEPIANVSLMKKLLFSIWMLRKQESFSTVGKRFRIPKSSGHGIFKYIIGKIVEMMPEYINWPNRQQKNHSANIFKKFSHGIPGIIGAIGCCHISIKQPVSNDEEFYNQQQHHSIILQVVCDEKCRFIDVFVGMPGKMSDLEVFKKSLLYQRLNEANNSLLHANQHILGNSKYPLMTNLMPPYKDNRNLTERQINYNSNINEILYVTKQSFKILKDRFERLKYLDICDINFANQIIAAACICHNFIINCENSNVDGIDDREIQDDQDIQICDVEENTSYAQQKREYIMNIL